MKNVIALAAAAAALAACASTPDQVAYDDQECQIVMMAPANATGRYSHMTEMDQRFAEMQLGTSDVRRRAQESNPGYENNIEKNLRNCANKSSK